MNLPKLGQFCVKNSFCVNCILKWTLKFTHFYQKLNIHVGIESYNNLE